MVNKLDIKGIETGQKTKLDYVIEARQGFRLDVTGLDIKGINRKNAWAVHNMLLKPTSHARI